MATKQQQGRTHTPAKSDAYTGILVVSLLALAGGAVLLYLDFDQYSKTKPPALPALTKPSGQPAGQGGVAGQGGAAGMGGVAGQGGAAGMGGVAGQGGAAGMGGAAGVMGAKGGNP